MSKNFKLDLNRVKAERIAKGFSQEEVSRKMGWNARVTYSKRECGIVPFGVDEFLKLIQILGFQKEQAHLFFLETSLPKGNKET